MRTPSGRCTNDRMCSDAVDGGYMPEMMVVRALSAGLRQVVTDVVGALWEIARTTTVAAELPAARVAR